VVHVDQVIICRRGDDYEAIPFTGRSTGSDTGQAAEIKRRDIGAANAVRLLAGGDRHPLVLGAPAR